ncbi:hypothetical protein ABG067_003951 [Albugo candida]
MVNIVSLSSLRRDEENDEDRRQPNSYYAGGTHHGGGSGLSVIGPGNGERTDHIGNIIARAQAMSNSESGPSTQPNHVITFYRNGFTVNGGVYRPRDDPANRPFLEAIERGVVPMELESADRSQHVDISLIDKRQEEYQAPPPPQYTAFSGEGQSMGSASSGEGTIFRSGNIAAVESPVVDDKKPVTTLQIRLHNGTRLRSTLNLTHTLRDVHAIIEINGTGDQPYILLEGFPPRPIAVSMDDTIEQAGLKGASLTQKVVNGSE